MVYHFILSSTNSHRYCEDLGGFRGLCLRVSKATNGNSPGNRSWKKSAASTISYPLSSPWSTTLLFWILGWIWRFYLGEFGRSHCFGVWEVNSSRKSGFHDPNEFFIVVFFSEEENPWLHHPRVPHQCRLFLIMVKVFRSRLSQPKKTLE